MSDFLKQQATHDSVENAYRLILGREPENLDVVRGRVKRMTNYQLRNEFLSSPEFKGIYTQHYQDYDMKLGALAAITLDNEYDPMQIEYTADDAQLKMLMKHIENVWSDYGKNDPFFSALSSENNHSENITDATINEFYKTGKHTLFIIEQALKRCSVWERIKGKKCLEFGCGLGRVTIHLASLFSSIHGVDISKNHLFIFSYPASA